MKKLLIALAILASVQVANAQANKALQTAKAAVESAKADSQNAKKNTKVATWLNLGKAYMTAYEAPVGNILPGSSKSDLALLMAGERPSSTTTVELGGQTLQKESYFNKNLYFNENGVLQIVEVTSPVVANALEEALKAYKKAAEVDDKGAKAKDIAAALKTINEKFTEDAYTYYQLDNFAEASKMFRKAYEASKVVAGGEVDYLALYNTGFTAQHAGDLAGAKAAYQECLDNKYYGEGGDIFAKLGTIAADQGDKASQKKILEDGFAQFPQSQSILIGLINYYVSNNEDSNRLFELIDNAKKNEPTNASLYYVEGNIHHELGDDDKAIAAYEQCSKIDPNYEYGYIGTGILYYNQAVALQEQAQAELDDAKYMKLVEQFEAALKGCIAPFKKAFDVTKDDSIKVSVAEYLKNATYRFRDESADMQADYDKFKGISDAGTAK